MFVKFLIIMESGMTMTGISKLEDLIATRDDLVGELLGYADLLDDVIESGQVSISINGFAPSPELAEEVFLLVQDFYQNKFATLNGIQKKLDALSELL
jgi:hypothetical protein